MKSGALSRRYAQALIDIGKEEDAFEKYGKELRDLVATFSGSPVLYKVLLNPMFGLDERKSLAVKVAEAVGASDIVTKFLVLLVTSRNIKLLDDICQAYARMEDELAGRVRVTLEAPEELADDLVAEIKKRLVDETGKEVVLSFEKNPSLVGGVVIRIGNMVLDGSVKSQLERMRERLLGGAA